MLCWHEPGLRSKRSDGLYLDQQVFIGEPFDANCGHHWTRIGKVLTEHTGQLFPELSIPAGLARLGVVAVELDNVPQIGAALLEHTANEFEDIPRLGGDITLADGPTIPIS